MVLLGRLGGVEREGPVAVVRVTLPARTIRPRSRPRPVGEDLLRQHAVDLVVGVGTAVVQDGDLEVEVGRLAQGGKDDSAGRDAGQHQRVDAQRSEHDVEVAAREGADPALGDGDLAASGATRACTWVAGPFSLMSSDLAKAENDWFLALASGAPSRKATRTKITGSAAARAAATAPSSTASSGADFSAKRSTMRSACP